MQICMELYETLNRLRDREEKDGRKPNTTAPETTARPVTSNLRSKMSKVTSQVTEFQPLLTARVPAAFLERRQLTESWMWTSCREYRTWTCQAVLLLAQ